MLSQADDDEMPSGRLTWWQAFGTTTAEVESAAELMLNELLKQEIVFPVIVAADVDGAASGSALGSESAPAAAPTLHLTAPHHSVGVAATTVTTAPHSDGVGAAGSSVS